MWLLENDVSKCIEHTKEFSGSIERAHEIKKELIIKHYESKKNTGFWDLFKPTQKYNTKTIAVDNELNDALYIENSETVQFSRGIELPADKFPNGTLLYKHGGWNILNPLPQFPIIKRNDMFYTSENVPTPIRVGGAKSAAVLQIPDIKIEKNRCLSVTQNGLTASPYPFYTVTAGKDVVINLDLNNALKEMYAKKYGIKTK